MKRLSQRSQRTYTLDTSSSNQIRQNSYLFNNTEDINQLKSLFLHYSNNETILTTKQYVKFLTDAQLFDPISLTQKYANILFYSFTKAKNTLTFQSFCDLILKIIELKYPDDFFMNQPSAVTLFFNTYVYPLLDILLSTRVPKKGNDNKNAINFHLIISKIASSSNQNLIEQNYLLFSKIYSKYFCFEKLNISKSQKSHLSQRAFCKVMRDFEICPYYISVAQLNEIFNELMTTPDFSIEIISKIINSEVNSNIGMYFTLYHFIVSLYLVSVLNIINTQKESDDSNINGNLYEIFLNNNDSLAYEKVIKLFITSKELNKVIPNEIKEFENEKKQPQISNSNNIETNQSQQRNLRPEIVKARSSNITSQSELIHMSSPTISLRDKMVNDNEKLCTIETMYPFILSKYYFVLINIYKFYSELYFETNFSIYMTQNGFIKFLRDIGLVDISSTSSNSNKKSTVTDLYVYNKMKANLLSFANINVFFSKYSSIKPNERNSSSNKKINFESFLKIILCLSNKLYNPQYNSISYDNKSFSIDYLTQDEFPIKYAFCFIENYISPLYTDLKNFIEEESFSYENLTVLFSSSPLNKFVRDIVPCLINILKVYTDGKNMITYNQYFKMLCDFEIFPDLISRTRMIKIFLNFIDNFDKDYIITGNNKIALSVDRCANAILFIAVGLVENQNVKIDNGELLRKIIYFVQRMIQTKGLEIVTKKSGIIKISREFIKVFNDYKKIV